MEGGEVQEGVDGKRRDEVEGGGEGRELYGQF